MNEENNPPEQEKSVKDLTTDRVAAKQRLINSQVHTARLNERLNNLCKERGWTKVTIQLDDLTVYSSVVEKFPATSAEFEAILNGVAQTLPETPVLIGCEEGDIPELQNPTT